MIDKDMKKKDLRAKTGLSYSTIGKLENGDIIRVDVLERVCRAMHCTFDDIAEIIPDKSNEQSTL